MESTSDRPAPNPAPCAYASRPVRSMVSVRPGELMSVGSSSEIPLRFEGWRVGHRRVVASPQSGGLASARCHIRPPRAPRKP